MKNYLEHQHKVRYIDGILAHSQSWQWFIDIVQETYSVRCIHNWDEFENAKPLREVFEFFVRIQEVSDGIWQFSVPEFLDLWAIARYYLNKIPFDTAAADVATTYGKLMLFCIWLTKLGNGSLDSSSPRMLYDIRLLKSRNAFQLIDITPFIAEEKKILGYISAIEVDGLDKPMECLTSNLLQKEQAFSRKLLEKHQDKMFSYNAFSYQTISIPPYSTWQEEYLFDMLKVSISKDQLQPCWTFGSSSFPNFSLWTPERLSAMKEYFGHAAASLIIDSIAFMLYRNEPSQESVLTHIRLLLTAFDQKVSLDDIVESSSFQLMLLLLRSKMLKGYTDNEDYRNLWRRLHEIVDPEILIKTQKYEFPLSTEQKKILFNYGFVKAARIDQASDGRSFLQYSSDQDIARHINPEQLVMMSEKFGQVIESVQGVMIPILYYKYMAFLLCVANENASANKAWVHAEMIRIQHRWKQKHYNEHVQTMQTIIREQKVDSWRIKRSNEIALANPVWLAQRCMPCSDEELITIMQSASENPMQFLINRVIVSPIFPNGDVNINRNRHEIDQLLFEKIESLLETNGYKMLNILSPDKYLSAIHNRFDFYTRIKAATFYESDKLYEIVCNNTDISLLPYSKQPSLAHLTQLFPVLEGQIREFAALFGIFPFKKTMDEFMQYNDPSSLLREVLMMVYKVQGSLENVPDLLFVYNAMYNSNSLNIRNECVHARDYLHGSSLEFAFTVTLFALHMIIFRINTIKANVSDILEISGGDIVPGTPC